MGAPNYITDNKGNIVYPRTLAKCVKKGGTTLDDYLDKVEDNLLIKPTAQGTDIQLKDSSDMNIQELHLLGKTEQKTTNGVQLFNINDRLTVTISTFSPIYNISEDGYITANIPLVGTEKYYNFFTKPSSLLKINKEYSAVIEIVDNPLNLRVTAISVQENIASQFSNNVFSTQVGTNITKVTTIDDFSKAKSMCRGYIYVPANISGTVKFRVSIIEGTSVTASKFKYEPYTGGQPSPSPDYPQGIESVENPTISVAGKNKAKEYKVNKTAKPYTTILSIDADLEANKEYSLSFIAAKGLWFYFNENLFTYDMKQATGDYQTIKLKTVATLSKDNPNQFNKSLQKWIILKTDAKNTVVADFDKVQLEEGNVGTAYEEYKEIQSAQPTCELNGIDDVRDELIVRADGTGQLIQRLAKKIMDGSNIDASASGQQEGSYLVNIETVSDMLTGNYNVGLSTICSNKRSGKEKNTIRFGANNKNVYLYLDESFAGKTPTELRKYFVENPFTIVYPLEKPIVTNLSAEEVQKILNLHTNKTNTTIWNDQDAEMQVTYVADTKKYIDDKFEELSEAITTSTTINSLDTSN